MLKKNQVKRPVFVGAEIVIAHNWDKKGLYYNLEKKKSLTLSLLC